MKLKKGLGIDEMLKDSTDSETDEYIERHRRAKQIEKMNKRLAHSRMQMQEVAEMIPILSYEHKTRAMQDLGILSAEVFSQEDATETFSDAQPITVLSQKNKS